MHHERVLAAMQTQADTVARLERELAEANDALATISLGILSKGTEETIADAEALRALAAWVNADKGWRKVSEICSGELFAFEVTIQFWRGNDGKQQVRGEADTLAAAIMDAIGQVGK